MTTGEAIDQLRAERDQLATALRALIWLEDHATAVTSPHGAFRCQPCGSFVAALWRGQRSADVLHLRCAEAQERQREATAGFELVGEVT